MTPPAPTIASLTHSQHQLKPPFTPNLNKRSTVHPIFREHWGRNTLFFPSSGAASPRRVPIVRVVPPPHLVWCVFAYVRACASFFVPCFVGLLFSLWGWLSYTPPYIYGPSVRPPLETSVLGGWPSNPGTLLLRGFLVTCSWQTNSAPELPGAEQRVERLSGVLF